MLSVKLYLPSGASLPEEIRKALEAKLPKGLAEKVVVNHILADVKYVRGGRPGHYAEVRGSSEMHPFHVELVVVIVLRFIGAEVYYPNGSMSFSQRRQTTG